MIEITTNNSTKVNELLFAFGNLRSEVMVMTMTTPTLSPFHQKIFAHAKFAKFATDIYLTKNNPFRPASAPRTLVGALRPWRAKARPGTAGREQSAFTLIELLAVITIIGILAGLTLGAAGAVRRHGAASTAKAEVAALQAACDRYFADNNAYPVDTAPDPTKTNNPTGSTALFTNLLGSATLTAAPTSKRYFEPKPAMVSGSYFVDPWGYPYGYNCSTNTDGTWNPPLIWSTAGGGNTNRWITSWPKM